MGLPVTPFITTSQDVVVETLLVSQQPMNFFFTPFQPMNFQDIVLTQYPMIWSIDISCSSLLLRSQVIDVLVQS